MSSPRTITFQPDPDVRRIIAMRLRSFGRSTKRGARTKIINEAIRRLIAAEATKAEVAA